MKPSSAAPTGKELIALRARGLTKRLDEQACIRTGFAEKTFYLLKDALETLEAPPAAERTASADIAHAIWENDDFQDALEMIRQGIKQEQFTAYTKILQAIKSEIDASEGTKSE